jgi:four helix bundle protein
MPPARRFEDLIVWQEARELSHAIEDWLTETDSIDRSYLDQLRRAMLSVELNIAEGFDRFRHTDFHRFLTIAKGSLAEVRALLHNGMDRRFVTRATCAELVAKAERLARRLATLMRYLRSRNGRNRK